MPLFQSLNELKRALAQDRFPYEKWPQWTLHRGLHENCPENSAEAFRAGAAIGFTSFETDVRSTKDGYLVFSHDANLRRLTGKNIVIAEAHRKEIENIPLKAPQHFDSVHLNVRPENDPPQQKNSTVRLLFFDAWYEEFHNFQWILDIKPETAEHVIYILSQRAKEYNFKVFLQEKVRFLFWRYAHKKQFLKYLPMAHCLAGEGECWLAGLSTLLHLSQSYLIKQDKYYGLPPCLYKKHLYTQDIVAQYKKHQAKIIAYLPQEFADVKRALLCGLDEILVNSLHFS